MTINEATFRNALARRCRFLPRLLGAMKPEEFFSVYWGRKPLVIRRHTSPLDISRLASLGRFENILKSHRSSSLLITEFDPKGNYLGNGHSFRNLRRRIYQKGHTILFRSVHKYWPQVDRLAVKIGRDLACEVQGNLYWSGPGGRAFPVHWDTHDVLAVQVEGEKRWSLYRAPIRNPVAHYHESKDYAFRPGRRLLEVTLKPGDILFIPRGTPHVAGASPSGSAHLALGLVLPTWLDWLHGLLEKKLLRASSRIRYREIYPGLLPEIAASRGFRSLQDRFLQEFLQQCSYPT